MRNVNLISCAAAIASAILFLGLSGGPGSVAGLAVTTSPGETAGFCGNSSCHGEGAFNQTTTIELQDLNGDAVVTYKPDSAYQVVVTISAAEGEPSAYGFQMVALLDADDSGTDSWQGELPNDIQAVRLLDRDYVEHLGPKTTGNTFTVGWTAPSAGSGSVTFYAAGNAVNLNGSSSGDGADTVRLSIDEMITSSIENIASTSIRYTLAPNPARDLLTLTTSEAISATLVIQDLIGQQMVVTEVRGQNHQLSVGALRAGMYMLGVYNQDGQPLMTEKLIIQ